VNRVIAHFGSKGILLQYYTQERVMSEAAKREWIEPDLKAISTQKAGTQR
jgi:hypothetical protein